MAGVNNEDLFGAFNTLRNLEADSSTTSKRSYLRATAGNPVLRKILLYAYDTSKVFYIRQVGAVSPWEQATPIQNFNQFFNLLDTLSERKLTGAEAIGSLSRALGQMSELEAKWYTRVLKKDLNIGVKTTMINQEIPGLIPVFQVQLAKEFDGRLPECILVQPKLDGYRCLAHTTTGFLFSRNGKRLEGYTTLEEQIRQLPKGYQLDCEIMSENFKGTQSSAFSHTVGKKGILNAFDLIEESEEEEDIPQYKRSKSLSELLKEFSPLDHIHNVPYRLIDRGLSDTKLDTLYESYSQYVAEGYEGAMIKDAEAPYERKRTRNWQKLKPVKTIDLKVTGLEEGNEDTKYVGMVGRLVCNFEGNEVRVGSGLSDYQRKLWWDNPLLVVGKTVELIYQEVSTNQAGGKSLRFPRLKCVRTDK